ncbi:MAG: cobalamin B12-binding domain-containing protein [Armatimonadota bacterium]
MRENRRDRFDDYMLSLLAGDAVACVRIAWEAAQEAGIAGTYLDYIQPAQIHLGEMWESRRISVAMEHLGTGINTSVVSALCTPIIEDGREHPKMVMTCVPGEMHDFGARLAANMLELNGWNVKFLGASMPADDLLGYVEGNPPKVFGISAAMTQHIPAMEKLIRRMRNAFGEECPKIIVGGQAFWKKDRLWERVGADLWARDAMQAARVLRPLADTG